MAWSSVSITTFESGVTVVDPSLPNVISSITNDSLTLSLANGFHLGMRICTPPLGGIGFLVDTVNATAVGRATITELTCDMDGDYRAPVSSPLRIISSLSATRTSPVLGSVISTLKGSVALVERGAKNTSSNMRSQKPPANRGSPIDFGITKEISYFPLVAHFYRMSIAPLIWHSTSLPSSRQACVGTVTLMVPPGGIFWGRRKLSVSVADQAPTILGSASTLTEERKL